MASFPASFRIQIISRQPNDLFVSGEPGRVANLSQDLRCYERTKTGDGQQKRVCIETLTDLSDTPVRFLDILPQLTQMLGDNARLELYGIVYRATD